MFDPLTLGLGTAIFFALKKQAAPNFGVMTPQREEIYRNALEHLRDPLKLKTLADTYEQQGLKLQATLMRKRADWYGRSPEKRAEHNVIFAKAMLSENASAILEVAKAFESWTATIKAAALYERVKFLRDQAIPTTTQTQAAPKAAHQAASAKVTQAQGTSAKTQATASAVIETTATPLKNGKEAEESVLQ